MNKPVKLGLALGICSCIFVYFYVIYLNEKNPVKKANNR